MGRSPQRIMELCTFFLQGACKPLRSVKLATGMRGRVDMMTA